MRQLQFFVFALFLIWFANSGKLRALWTALRADAPPGQASVQTPQGVAIIGADGQQIVVPGAGGNPQIAPGVG